VCDVTYALLAERVDLDTLDEHLAGPSSTAARRKRLNLVQQIGG
jgi:hypothetical protein